MTRQEAIERCGRETVEAVERENCEPTNRVIDSNEMEWSASVPWGHGLLTIYYMTTKADEEEVINNGGDWGAIYWDDRVDRYEVQ